MPVVWEGDDGSLQGRKNNGDDTECERHALEQKIHSTTTHLKFKREKRERDEREREREETREERERCLKSKTMFPAPNPPGHLCGGLVCGAVKCPLKVLARFFISFQPEHHHTRQPYHLHIR